MDENIEKDLYKAIEDNSAETTVIDLLNRGADCNLSHYDPVTSTFVCPIQLAADNDRHSLLRLLYEHRKSPTKTQLEKHVAYYMIHHDQSNQKENETLFEYTISRLFYFYITEHKTKQIFDTFIIALHDFDDATHRDQDLCGGSRREKFLPLRIHTLFRTIIDQKINSNIDMIEIIENELLHNLEMYYFFISISFIPVTITLQTVSQSFSQIKSDQPELIEYYQCIAKNVINKIIKLDTNDEYTIPAGWIRHAVCVSFQRISQTHIIIRIDNPSSKNPQNMHEIERSIDGHDRIKPKVLGQLHVDNLDANLDNYFVLLIDSVKRRLTFDEGTSLIYNLGQNIHHLEEIQIETLPYFDVQARANCFVKCFEPGIRIRTGKTHPEFYDQLLLWEQNNANTLAMRCQLEQQPSSNNLFGRFTFLSQQTNTPTALETSLENRLKTSYKQHYQYLSSNINIETPLLFNEKYVHSRFKNKNTLIELKDILIKPRVLMLGDAGCGKTTACQYITYAWANGEFWQDQFDWLFYIKMRNLNSQFYPSLANNYSLIDIVESECFQGYKLTALEKQQLTYLFTNPSKILWILDGCDERVIPPHLLAIQRELLAKPRLLLTSRAYATDDLLCDTQIQIERFTDEDISKYIKMYFSYTLPTEASECWLFIRHSIRHSDHLRETARIPECLELMCRLWEIDKNKFEFDMTMGQLYEKMYEYLLRRYLFKFHNQRNFTLVGEDIYQEPNAIAFVHLERLAFQATQLLQLTISGNEITNIDSPLFISVLQIGLLVPERQQSSFILDGNIYYFIHRSFQEYLSARYMIRILESSSSNDQKREVICFITDQKYNRHTRDTFRLFFELKRSSSCTDQFWSAVDSEPRDLVGLRHYSRIAHWFPNGICGFSHEDRQKISQRGTNVVLAWISNRNRLPHDIGNKYIFESFADPIGHQYWIDAWKVDLDIEDPSKRRYFLRDLWSEKNIEILKENYDRISTDVEGLHNLIETGPNTVSRQRLNLPSNLINLYETNDQTETLNFLREIQKKAKQHESITSLTELQALLEHYKSFANLNLQLAADGSIIWKLKIEPSVFESIDDDTLHRLSELSKEDVLFFRYFKIPVIPFLNLYANRNDIFDDLCSLIVLITMSNNFILTAPPLQNKLIRVYYNKLIRVYQNELIRVYKEDSAVDIEMHEHRRSNLIHAFKDAREIYGHCSFFRHDE